MPMFCLSMVFLMVLAVLLVLWVEVPLFLSAREGEAMARSAAGSRRDIACWISPETATIAGRHCLLLLAAIWPLFLFELVFQYAVRDRTKPFLRRRYRSLLVCLFPPLRMCARNPDMDGKIWFPSLGWQPVNRRLRKRLEKAFSVPMIFIALAILPVLLVEFGMRQTVIRWPWLQFMLHASTGVIWFAFATEFIVMVSVAEKKLAYCKAHWIDIAIILLPFISFLRSLRAVRAMRLARVAKVQQLSKMGRVYRLRGLAMRVVRALMILELFNRVFRIGPERRLEKLNTILEEKMREIEVLRGEIARLEREVEHRKQSSERRKREAADV